MKLYMVSAVGNDLVFGDICKKSNTIRFAKMEDSEVSDESALGIYQFTNLLA